MLGGKITKVHENLLRLYIKLTKVRLVYYRANQDVIIVL